MEHSKDPPKEYARIFAPSEAMPPFAPIYGPVVCPYRILVQFEPQH